MSAYTGMHTVCLRCISCGSFAEGTERLTLDYYSPILGRQREQIKVKWFCDCGLPNEIVIYPKHPLFDILCQEIIG